MSRELMQGVEFSHFLLQQQITEGALTIDATAGNGKDTLFLAEQVGPSGKVLAFDIQKEAINRTRKKLNETGLINRVELIYDSHENMHNYADENKMSAILFNLGYLPGGNKDIVTSSDTTLKAVASGLNLIKPGGLMVLVIYTGHPGGTKEQQELLKYSKDLPAAEFNVLHYHYLNQKNPPSQVLVIKKRLKGYNQ